MAFLALLLAQAPTPAAAACAAMDQSLPAGLAAWTRPGTVLTVGAAATLAAGVAVPDLPAPTHSGQSAAVRFTVAEGGTYAVALDQAAWMDVLPLDAAGHASGPALRTAGSAHGPACSTIRKVVRFNLTAGAYALQISGLARPEVRAMLVPGAVFPFSPAH